MTRTVVESLDHEGHGVSHVDGKTIFIDGALPGDGQLDQCNITLQELTTIREAMISWPSSVRPTNSLYRSSKTVDPSQARPQQY